MYREKTRRYVNKNIAGCLHAASDLLLLAAPFDFAVVLALACVASTAVTRCSPCPGLCGSMASADVDSTFSPELSKRNE